MSAPQSPAGLRNLQANPAKFRVSAEQPALVAAPVSEEESESIAALGVTVVSERGMVAAASGWAAPSSDFLATVPAWVWADRQ